LKSLVLDHIWLSGIGLAFAGTALLLVACRALVEFTAWLKLKMIVKSGRTIKWVEAIERCIAGPAIIVLESKMRRPSVWLLAGRDESAFFSRRGSPRSKGLLVLDPPDIGRIFEEVAKAGGKVVEVDMNATLW
jgi:hypothetical protein